MSESKALARTSDEDRRLIAQIREKTGHDLVRIALVRQKMAASLNQHPRGVPMRDVLLFMLVEKELGLDSLLNQIHWIKRGDKSAHQVGIDGFRAIADRSKVYAGSEAAVFRGTLEIERSGDQPPLSVPESASVTVRKLVDGHVVSFVGVAFWTEFYPTNEKEGFMYRKMPRHMLAKDAEAQALRKAFPSQLSGLDYSPTADAITVSEAVTVADTGATRYGEIFGGQDDVEPSGRALLEQAEEDGGVDAAAESSPPSDAWTDNARLSVDAEALGIKVRTLRNNTPLEQVEAYNQQLTDQILAKQVAGV